MNILNIVREQLLKRQRVAQAQLVAVKAQKIAVYRGVPYEIK
tara:strand:- start:7256 stop:7381 length:126 start_codon:yes stop_codon:yes gene_type:complete